jgi:predicted nucleic acid-binding protein
VARKPKAYVLDSWAVLAYLEDEDAGPKVAELMAKAAEQGVPLLMCVVNAAEVWYILAREVSDADAERGIEILRHLGIEFVDVDWQLARLAGTFKSKNRMSYADCFAAALALQHKAELVTGDREFEQVADSIGIRWLAH